MLLSTVFRLDATPLHTRLPEYLRIWPLLGRNQLASLFSPFTHKHNTSFHNYSILSFCNFFEIQILESSFKSHSSSSFLDTVLKKLCYVNRQYHTHAAVCLFSKTTLSRIRQLLGGSQLALYRGISNLQFPFTKLIN